MNTRTLYEIVVNQLIHYYILEGDLLESEEDNEIISLISSGNDQLLKDLIVLRTNRWKYHLIIGEYTTGLFSDLERKLNEETAFRLIRISMQIVLEQSDSDLITTSLSLLMDLVRTSNTTEIPEGLIEGLSILDNMKLEIDDKEYIKSIRNWYRI
ncbi:hypothetical protein [Cohnella sp. WQ 127256]|uniref:hypothetical protein n=1 Tax=Cohnella sp. WQ 127256 TaxID=2938790 RepID=UPI002118CDE4|nr:hypothetical protein [Cohnella sp. WQ 127256]